MGAHVGAIESAVGGRHTRLSPIGVIFPVTDANLRRWNGWWRYVVIDQVLVWALFCAVGMFLTVNLATSVVPPGTTMEGLATGAYQAQSLYREFLLVLCVCFYGFFSLRVLLTFVSAQ